LGKFRIDDFFGGCILKRLTDYTTGFSPLFNWYQEVPCVLICYLKIISGDVKNLELGHNKGVLIMVTILTL